MKVGQRIGRTCTTCPCYTGLCTTQLSNPTLSCGVLGNTFLRSPGESLSLGKDPTVRTVAAPPPSELRGYFPYWQSASWFQTRVSWSTVPVHPYISQSMFRVLDDCFGPPDGLL